jgi:hypothetical protein
MAKRPLVLQPHIRNNTTSQGLHSRFHDSWCILRIFTRGGNNGRRQWIVRQLRTSVAQEEQIENKIFTAESYDFGAMCHVGTRKRKETVHVEHCTEGQLQISRGECIHYQSRLSSNHDQARVGGLGGLEFVEVSPRQWHGECIADLFTEHVLSVSLRGRI